MESNSSQKQTGSCVDPLWDDFSAEDVTEATRVYCLDSEENVSKRSTPLTPQEFELMSSSNPFKQDIAEKYGLAYPGITTRSHGREVFDRTVLELGDVWDSTTRQRREYGDTESFIQDYGNQKGSSSENQSVFVALSQFLLRNRQSIDESLKKIDETDSFISHASESKDAYSEGGDLRFSDLVDEGWTIVEKNEPAPDIIGSLADTSGDTLIFDGLMEDTTNDDWSCVFSAKYPVGSVKDVLDETLSKCDQGSFPPEQEKRQDMVKDKSHLGKEHRDPYSAIRDEDIFRKRDHGKTFSEGGATAFSQEDSLDIPHLSTRSFEVAELSSRLPSVLSQTKQTKVDNATSQTKLTKLGGENVQRSGTQNANAPSSSFNKSSEVFTFDNSFPDKKLSFSRPAGPRGSSFAEEGKSVPQDDLLLSSDVAQNLSGDTFKTVRVQKVDSGDLDLVYGSITSPFRENVTGDVDNGAVLLAVKDKAVVGNVSSSDDKAPVGESLSLDDGKPCEQVPKSRTDHFSSSFYAVFSTTVSSLEDSEEHADDSEGKNVEAATTGDKALNTEMLNGLQGSVDIKTKDNDDVSDVFGIAEVSNEDHLHEIPVSNWCISKEILLQKQFHISEDSGDSSRGSVSRESMKVNASQDSYILDHLDDSLVSVPETNVQLETLSHCPIKLGSHFETLLESTSTDSILVHFSSDSLHVLDNTESATLQRPLQKTTRRPLSSEFGARERDTGTRRQSLPAIQTKRNGQNFQNVFSPTKSVDICEERTQRRSSIPAEIVKPEEIKTFIRSQSKEKTDNDKTNTLSTSSSFTSQIEKRDEYKKQREGKKISEDFFETSAESYSGVSISSDVTIKTNGRGLSDTSTARTTFASSAASTSECSSEMPDTEHVDAVSGVTTESGSRDDESPTYSRAFADFIMSRIQKSPEVSKPMETTASHARDAQGAEYKPSEAAASRPRVTPSSTSKPDESAASCAKQVERGAAQPSELTNYQERQTPSKAYLTSSVDTSSGLDETKAGTAGHKEPEKQQTPEENVVSQTEMIPRLEQQHSKPLAVPEEIGFLEQNKEFTHNVNIMIPPDLVPYEEVYTESLQSLPEVGYELAASAVEAETSRAESGSTLARASEEHGEKILEKNEPSEGIDKRMKTAEDGQNGEYSESYKASINMTQYPIFIETREFDVHTSEPSKSTNSQGDSPTARAKEESSGGNLKSESSSDSDGGDIDTIVQEFKQATSDSDECDIDDLVMEFKKDNPEQEVQSPGDSDEGRHRAGSAFTKFGRVLNKMQSVTKYMSKKKGDEGGSKDVEEKWKSAGQIGKQRKSYSQDEGAMQSGVHLKDKEEGEDGFELLSKAAEVFKEQAVKKKVVSSMKPWRSKTLHAENVEPDDEGEYDLVAKAAVLFRGFKSKKLEDADLAVRQTEVGGNTSEQLNVEGSTGKKSEIGELAGEKVETGGLTDEKSEIGELTGEKVEIGEATSEKVEIGGLTVETSEIGGSAGVKSEMGKLAGEKSEIGGPAGEIAEVKLLTYEKPEYGELKEEISIVEKLTDEKAVGDETPEVKGLTCEKSEIDGLTGGKLEVSGLIDEQSEEIQSINFSATKMIIKDDTVSTRSVPLSGEDSQVVESIASSLEMHYNAKNAAIIEEVVSPELETLETFEVIDSLVKSEELIDSDVSRLEDSGFESVTRHISEQLVRSDATESFCADLAEDVDIAADYSEIPVVEPGNVEISHEKVVATDEVRKNEADLTFSEEFHDVSDSLEETVPKFPDYDIVFQQETNEDKNIKDQMVKETTAESVTRSAGAEKNEDDEIKKEVIFDSSGSRVELNSPPEPRVLNEQTCDLILSTRYDEAKVKKKIEPALSDETNEQETEVQESQREKTNGRLDKIAHEISSLEAAGMALATGKQGDSLEVQSPEYQRLSSESSEGGPDAHSMTVNFPESPDHMKNLEDDPAFSLCCGGNFKIHLNCTAMVKKPERRPSAVVISDKRCAMTDEEKMFPQKVGVSYREGQDNSPVMLGSLGLDRDAKNDGARIKMIQDLKVNEHELNRNFAGSREELLEEESLKQKQSSDLESKRMRDETGKKDKEIFQNGQEMQTPELIKEGMEKRDETEKKREKRKSLVEDLDKDKQTINVYESVLDELIKRQSQEGEKKKNVDSVKDEKIMEKSKRFGRVISDSDFDENFGNATEENEHETKKDKSKIDPAQAEAEKISEMPAESHIVNRRPGSRKMHSAAPHVGSKVLMQQSIDVYDNVVFPEVAPPLPERCPRQNIHGSSGDTRGRHDPRFANGARSSLTSVVSDGAAEDYNQVRRHPAHQRRTKWVSSTPHLSSTEKREQIPSNRTSSYPHLLASDSDLVRQHPYSNAPSAFSLGSDSVCWGNYARIDDVQDRRSYDSESSTSGLVIPGVGRESTLSDVSDAYIFGEYATVRDDINSSKVLRPLDGRNYQKDNTFQFKHFPAALEESHYQNVSVITVQPTSTRYRIIPSNMDVHEDLAPGYAIIGLPMQSKSVQISPPSTPIGVIKVHCASQTSSESLAGLVRNDASDILEGLPVFEYTLGATMSTHSHLADAADSPTAAVYSDSRQPDLTQQTASLDRRKFKHVAGQSHSDAPKKKATKVTFSRDEVLTEVIDGIKKSERAKTNGNGLKNMATSTLSSLGGGVREFAKILYVPFHCCRSGRGEKPKPSEPRLLRHSFRLYHFRRPHRCFVCKQLVYNQGSACQVCRYICHRKCEVQVMTTCVPQVTSDLSNEALNKNQSSNRSIGLSSQTQSSMSSTMRDMLNKSQEQSQFEGNLALDVIYITERIISMTFPSEGHDTIYTFHLKEVVQMLKTKHGDNYLILNLSEKRQDLTKANPQVKEFGWPDHLAPPLERLCSLCKAIDSWLNADIRNVVILHCKGGRSRIASVIAAYMHYSNICASADQALDRFAMKRFYDEKLGGLPLPSQQRYVRYFSGLLSGSIKINSNPLYLHHILIHGVPNFDTKGGCRPFIKVYQGMQPIFTSGVYNVTDNMQKVCISISPGIPLRGDILIKCYHKKSRSGQREVMWQCQFHTCAISDTSLIFSKQELDDAIMDPRFPDNGKVEFVFGPSSDVLVSVSGFKSDVTVPVDDNEESLARSDSYENFNRAVEAIDGYQGPSSSFNSRFTSSAVTTNNLNNNVSSDIVNPSYTSQVYQTNQTNRRAAQTVEERTQLDELLSDLLSEQAYVSPTPRSPRSFQTAVQSQQTPISPSSGGGVASGPNMSSTRTINTSSRTYTTFSSADAHRHPDKLLIQRAEVSYKVPGQGEVKDHYTIAADPNDVLDTTPSKPAQQPQHPKGVPHNAFSYTAGLSSSQQSSSQRAEVVEHEVIRSQQASRDLQSPPSSRLPYRPDYDPRYETSSSSYQYSSLDGDTSSWLAQQQQKLKNFKEGRDSSGRTEQEKKLVNELRYAQNKYYTRRDQSDDEGRVFIDSQSRQTVQNGPTSPERVTSTYMAPQRSQSSTVVDGLWPQDQYYNTSYSSSSYTESHTYGGDKRSNKPPPSPTMQRSVLTTSAPAPIPARGSSKDYMRTRSSSSSSTWQQQGQQQQPRPLQRQQSDTIYDRNRDVEHILPRSYGSTHSTPPHSPRPISPSGPHSTTTYTTYRTIDRQRDVQDEMLRAKRVQQQQQQAPPPVQQPPTQINHHYITEVFVHRTDVNKDKADSSTRLDELEKNLEAASQSIKSSQQQAVHQVPQQQQMFEESMQTRSSRQYYTYQENKPEPPRVKEIEEDRIMLRPIGPGMQTLEPESAHTGTLGRPTTPGFPTGPATPPFPVSPRTPYQNTGLFGRLGGSQIISPTGTLQQPLQQQQHQTIQYQQYQSQQHYQTQSSHHDGHGQGTLHIDTSPKMLTAPQSPPSAGSPTSPSNFNTLRQQLSSAHSMSGSVISPGPHSMTGQSSPSVYFGLSRRGSLSSLTDTDMVHTTPKFVKDMSKYWYKPNITREEAIHMLKDKQPGTFVIRDSNSFPGAFGLALKVSTIPPNVQAKPSGDPQADLVRHFLIEPTPKGVRLRGCSNEPVFGSLAALVYQHSITPLALPCKLMLPEGDVDGVFTPESPMTATELNSAATLLAQGAACNVTFINSIDMESLTGPQAVAKAVKMTFENLAQGRTTVVHFKVSSQGITLTDNNRKLFFRRHYPVTAVTYCGMDPQDRRWKRELDAPGGQGDARIFGFVARKQGSANENTCHIFSELDPEQPASAIVNFVTKVMIGQSKVKS